VKVRLRAMVSNSGFEVNRDESSCDLMIM
jgi:hypothetical protein